MFVFKYSKGNVSATVMIIVTVRVTVSFRMRIRFSVVCLKIRKIV